MKTWQELRALRVAPPGRASDSDERRQTFGAALQQAEELASGADVVGYAAKPLLLFYSLSQATRAICATHLSDGDSWSPHGHGLKLDEFSAVLETPVIPTKSDQTLFGSTARACKSPPLGGPAPVGQLWAANPDIADLLPGALSSWLPPLRAPTVMASRPLAGVRGADLNAPVTTGGSVSVQLEASSLFRDGMTVQQAGAILAKYPSLERVTTFYKQVGQAGPTQLLEPTTAPDDPIAILRAPTWPFPVFEVVRIVVELRRRSSGFDD